MNFKSYSIAGLFFAGVVCATTVAAYAAPLADYGASPVTVEGPRGMFINPTSETLKEGDFAGSVCGAAIAGDSNYTTTYGQSLSYGVSESIEFGGVGLYMSGDPDQEVEAFGPQLKVRVLEEQDVLPELSLGGYMYFGDNVAEYNAAFMALAKRFVIADKGIVRAVTTHVGLRGAWFDNDAINDNALIGYAGLEIGLPKHLALIGEISTKDDLYNKMPWSFGIQAKHPDGIALSLAAVQPGFANEPAVFIGVGINF